MSKSTTLTKVALGLLCLFGGTAATFAEWTDLNLTQLMGDNPQPITVNNITTVEQVQYKITPTVDGTLYVDQTGSSDPHIYTSEDPEHLDWGGDVIFSYSGDSGNIYSGSYVLEKGQDYYFIARIGEYDVLTSVTFKSYVALENPEPLPMDETQVVNASTTVKYSYSPENSGTLVISSDKTLTPGETFLWSSVTYSESSKLVPYLSYSDDSQDLYNVYKYSVVAGNTYYFQMEAGWFDSNSFKAEYSNEIYVPGVTVLPEDNKGFDYGLYTDITITGTAELSLSKITLSYGEVEKDLTEFSGYSEDEYDYQISGPYNNILQVRMNAGLMDAILAAKAESFTITISDFTCGGTPLGENGTYVLNYTVPQEFNYLESESIWPEKLYTYYAPGNKDGIITLAFDQPVGSVSAVTLLNGTTVPFNEAYKYNFSIDLPFEINPANNKEVLIDMTGIDFNKELADFNKKMADSIEEGSDDTWTNEALQSTMTFFIMSVISTGNMTAEYGPYTVIYKTLTQTKENYPGENPPMYMTTDATSIPEASNVEAYTSLNNVTISWDSDVTALSAADVLSINVSLGTAAPVSAPAVVEQGKLVVDLSGVIKAPGYKGIVTVSVPGLLVENEKGEANNAQDFNYLVDIVIDDISEIEVTNLTPEISVSENFYVLQLTWDDVEVEFADTDAVVTVLMNGETIGTVTAENMSLEVSGESEPSIEMLAEVGDSGNILNVVFTELAKGAGVYTFNIPAGLVKTVNGGITNSAETVQVTLTTLAEGSVSPEAGTKFQAGTEVVLAFSFEGEEITVAASENFPVSVFMNAPNAEEETYDESFTWTDSELTLDPETGIILLNLGSELPVGVYTVVLRSESVMVDGVGNEELESSFEVVAKSSGINTLDAELLKGNNYNLNGVKVSNDLNNLKNGIYIINGKKVMIRK